MLIIAPDIFSIFSLMTVCCVFSLESPHCGNFSEYRVSQKTWTFFENAITPLLMEEFFSKFSVVVES